VSSTEAGLNYGWKCYEANNVYTSGCAQSGTTYTFPVASYSHSGGACSVTGGYVYTGATYPSLQGKYFFADLCVNRIGMVDVNTNAITYSATFSTGNPNNPGFSWTSFGQDVNGELYVASASLGKIFRITDSSLGVKQFGQMSLSLVPNPAVSEFFVKMSGANYPARVSVTDLTGKVVLAQTLESERTAVTTGMLQDGIYLVNVTDSTGAIAATKLGVTH